MPTYAHQKFAQHRLFAGMSREQKAWLVQVGREISLKKADLLFARGQVCDELYVMLEGYLKLSIPAEKGQEKVLEFLSAGDVCGEFALLPDTAALTNAYALEDCQLMAFRVKDVMAACGQAPGFTQQLLTNLSRRVESLFRDMESVSLRTAAQRVAEYILRQPRVGNLAKLPFHKRAIASKLGLQPETFSRSLQQLAADGLISVRGARVQIHDLVGLQAVLS
jgi:CRP/FNR family transcriptional regulator, dissimilatory nitrate respiration regulator